MHLKFTVSEPEVLAFSEQYYKDSPSTRRLRNAARWTLPVLLVPILATFSFMFDLGWRQAAVFGIGALVWIFVAPIRFDARLRRYMRKQMSESSYGKALGVYNLTIDEQQFVSEGPTGKTVSKLSAIDRVVRTDEFLFIFLAGFSGFPIRIAEIGASVAAEAYEELQALVEQAKTPQAD